MLSKLAVVSRHYLRTRQHLLRLVVLLRKELVPETRETTRRPLLVGRMTFLRGFPRKMIATPSMMIDGDRGFMMMNVTCPWFRAVPEHFLAENNTMQTSYF